MGVNAVGTVADVTTVFVLHQVMHFALLGAVFAGWSVSVTSGYVLSRFVVFADHKSPVARSTFRYGALVCLNLAVGVLGVTYLVDHGWNYLLTRLLSSSVLVIVNFIVSHRWVFAPGAPAPDLADIA